ncbi:hypothetical protein Tco_0735602 [Tanacetum coccineum]
MRIEPTMCQKEETFQVVLDIIKDSPRFKDFTITVDKFSADVELFRKILDIYLRVPNEDFVAPPSEEELITFLLELGYKGPLDHLARMFVDHMHQSWITLATIINKCLSRKTSSNDRLCQSRVAILWGVPNKSTDTFKTSSEGTGIKSGVPDEKRLIKKKLNRCLLNEEEEHQDDQDDDDDRSIDIEETDDDEKTNDEFVHDDEYVHDDDYVHNDVDEEMKDAKVAVTRKDNEEITDAEKTEATKGDHEKARKLPPKSSSLSISSGFVNEYLGLSLGDTLQKVLQKHTEELKQELQQQESQKSASEIIKIKQEHTSKQKWPKPLYEDDMDKAATAMGESTLLKRKHDDQDEAPTAGSKPRLRTRKTKGRPRKDTQPSKKLSTTKGSSKGNTPSKSFKFGMSVTAEELDKEHVHDTSLDAEENIIDETSNTNEHPDGEATPMICIELEYNMEECYKALADRLDWENPKGDRCLFDLSKHLPLKDHPRHLTVASEYFFNNDLEYLKSSNLVKKYTTSITKTKATRSKLNRFLKNDVLSLLKVLSVVSVTVNKLHGYGYLEEIVVRRAD